MSVLPNFLCSDLSILQSITVSLVFESNLLGSTLKASQDATDATLSCDEWQCLPQPAFVPVLFLTVPNHRVVLGTAALVHVSGDGGNEALWSTERPPSTPWHPWRTQDPFTRDDQYHTLHWQSAVDLKMRQCVSVCKCVCAFNLTSSQAILYLTDTTTPRPLPLMVHLHSPAWQPTQIHNTVCTDDTQR